jgi:NAD(P)-dependent dehydrogenase (short-subunit alcohol dehydrogenase family)
MSKAGLIALTRTQQRDFDKDLSRPDLIVNSMCPGYVKTGLVVIKTMYNTS